MSSVSTFSPGRLLLGQGRFLLLGAAFAGLAWNAYGIVQFLQTAWASAETFVARGMTLEQATLYASLPGWMTAAFALGVFGGAAGCVLLLARRKQAMHVLGASLAGYVVLFAGDVALGVFAAFGAAQVVVVSLALAIAAGLFVLARKAGRDGLLA